MCVFVCVCVPASKPETSLFSDVIERGEKKQRERERRISVIFRMALLFWCGRRIHLCPLKPSLLANSSLGAFPTICCGAKPPKDDGCVLRDRGAGSRRPLPPNFLTISSSFSHMHTCLCILTQKLTATMSTFVGVSCPPPPSPAGDSRVSGSLLSGPDGPGGCSHGPQAPNTH